METTQIIKDFQQEKMWHEHDFDEFLDYVKNKMDVSDNKEVQEEIMELETISTLIRQKIVSATILPCLLNEFGEKLAKIRLKLEFYDGQQ